MSVHVLTGFCIKWVEFRENVRAFSPGAKKTVHNNEVSTVKQVSIKWGLTVLVYNNLLLSFKTSWYSVYKSNSLQYKLHCKEGLIVTCIIDQGCALAEPSGPWRLTNVLGWLKNLCFFIEIICWAHWISIFLRVAHSLVDRKAVT